MSLPSVPDAFRWTEESWGAALRCRPLEAVAPHLFTTRQLALSSPEDLRRLAAAVGAREVGMVTQVHGARVVVVRQGAAAPSRGPSQVAECQPQHADYVFSQATAERQVGHHEGHTTDESSGPARRPEADVLVSNIPDVGIAVRAADCVPLLMADRANGVVAAVHAGWRGTAARAATAAVEALGREFGTSPADLTVAIGPSIGSCCYEVRSDLVDAFAAAGHARHLIDRWFLAPPLRHGSQERPLMRLDMAGANRDQLILAGVAEEHIHVSGLCTAMHLDVLTSFRVEKEKAGRMAGVIRMR